MNLLQAENSKRWEHWTTPEEWLDLVRELGPIAFDPCSNAASKVGATVAWDGSTPETDGLTCEWPLDGNAFVNPPWGRSLAKWSEQLVEQADFRCWFESRGSITVALLPARTSPAWARMLLERAHAIAFPHRRISYDNPPPGSPGGRPGVDSMFAFWGRRMEQRHFVHVFKRLCTVLIPA